MLLTCCIANQLTCSCLIDSCIASAVNALLRGCSKSSVGIASTILQVACVSAFCKGVVDILIEAILCADTLDDDCVLDGVLQRLC